MGQGYKYLTFLSSKFINTLVQLSNSMSDGDLDLSLSPIKKNVAKQGRRAGGSSWTGVDDDSQESWKELSQKPGQDDIFLDNRDRVSKDLSRRRTGGWADSRNNSFSQKTSSLDKTDHDHSNDDEDDLPIIPDLEEEPDENWTWEKLFADVSSQMQSEWFPTGGHEHNTNSNSSEQPEKQDRPFTAFNKFPV